MSARIITWNCFVPRTPCAHRREMCAEACMHPPPHMTCMQCMPPPQHATMQRHAHAAADAKAPCCPTVNALGLVTPIWSTADDRPLHHRARLLTNMSSAERETTSSAQLRRTAVARLCPGCCARGFAAHWQCAGASSNLPREIRVARAPSRPGSSPGPCYVLSRLRA
jgi:hypothetical protein